MVYRDRSYVLRCLPARTGMRGEVTWRFSLQEAAPESPRHAFNSLADLVTFLSTEIAREQVQSTSSGDEQAVS